jgi:hypothetical protein
VSGYDSYVRLIRQLDDLIGAFERHPDEATREQAIALLGGLDHLHREGLTRLVRRIRDAGGSDIMDHAASDPVVETLLGLYDLADLELGEPGIGDEPGPSASVTFVPLERLTVNGRRALPNRKESDG